ncbi:hypothetical protein A5797_000880, partial [Enterococcus faecalis]
TNIYYMPIQNYMMQPKPITK